MPPKPRTRVNVKMTQTSLLGGPISPPPKSYPRITMKSYAGPKTEEVAKIRLLLPYYVSYPYQGPFGLDIQPFAPGGIYNEALYENLIRLLYNVDMNDLDTYVSIDNLLKASFCATSIDTNIDYCRGEEDVGRYIYAPQPAYHLLVILREEQMNQNVSAEEMKIEAEEDSDFA